MLPALAAVLTGYALTLASGVTQPALPTENQQVADWLVAHHLRYGLGGYWQSATITLGSGTRAQVRQARFNGRARLSPPGSSGRAASISGRAAAQASTPNQKPRRSASPIASAPVVA
jgi:hypothetical protein